MVKCFICNQKFKRITYSHLNKHNIRNESEYLVMFPNAEIVSSNLKKLISERTKEGMNNPIVKEKIKYERTDKWKLRHSKMMREKHQLGNFQHIYTPDRNKKISRKKKEWWKNNPEMKLMAAQIAKKWKERDEIGFLKHRKNNAIKGYLCAIKSGENKFEKKIYNLLKNQNIEFEKQYQVDGKLFDAYLLKYNTLLEFDGYFFHKKSLNECKYPIQVKNYWNDLKKNVIANKNKFRLIRIRENKIDEDFEIMLGKLEII